MNGRIIRIYNSITQTGLSNAAQLAQTYKISNRTFRKDIDELNARLLAAGSAPISWEQGDALSCAYRQGDEERLEQSLSFYEYSLEDEERLYVLLLILMLNNRYVTLNEIAVFMQFSRNTILNDFGQLSGQLKQLGVYTHSQRARGVKLRKADEYRLRKFVIQYFKNHLFLLRLSLRELVKSELVNPQITNLLLDEAGLLGLISCAEKKSGFFLTESSRKGLTQFLLLMIARNTLGFPVIWLKNSSPATFLPLADDLIKNLNGYAKHLSFLDERFYVKELLMQADYIRMVEVPLSGERIKLQWNTKRFIRRISEELQINLNRDYLLYSGISEYLARSFADEYGHLEKRHYSSSADFVTQCYPRLEFCICKNLPLLERYSSYKMTEFDCQEILYFVHSAIIRMENLSVNLKVLLVCDRGEGLRALLYEQIKNKLNTSHIDLTISPLLKEQLQEECPDLIISTESLEIPDLPVTRISPAFTDEDAEKVYRCIQAIKNDCCRKRDLGESKSDNYDQAKKILLKQQAYHSQAGGQPMKLKYSFGNLLSWNCVKTDITVSDWREAVLKVCDILFQNGEISGWDIENALLPLEQERSFTMVDDGLAIVPVFGTLHEKRNHFSMSLIQLAAPVIFQDGKAPVHYVACVKIVRGCQHLKAIHYLVNMLRE